MASNIGGTATLVGDPPNIIIASRAGLSFNDFLVAPGPVRRGGAGRVPRAVPGPVPQGVPLRPGTGRRGDGAAGARRDPRPRGCWSSAWRCSRAGPGRVRACTPCCTSSRRWWPCSGGLLLLALSRLDADRGRRGRRVAHAGVLRRPVRHGRRAGQHRRDRPALPRAATDAVEGRLLAGHDAAAVGLGRAVGDRGQHPVRRHDEPDRRRPGPRRRRHAQAAGAVVGPRPRRRPGRQRHRRRRVAPTSWCWASPNAPGTGSASGSSPSTG